MRLCFSTSSYLDRKVQRSHSQVKFKFQFQFKLNAPSIQWGLIVPSVLVENEDCRAVTPVFQEKYIGIAITMEGGVSGKC